MSFAINTNTASLQAQEYLRTNSDFQAKTINRVTSGLRIISSGDDAAGLAIANTFRSDQSVLSQGVRNANDRNAQIAAQLRMNAFGRVVDHAGCVGRIVLGPGRGSTHAHAMARLPSLMA